MENNTPLTTKILVEQFDWNFHPRFSDKDPHVYNGTGEYVITSSGNKVGFNITSGHTASHRFVAGQNNDWTETKFWFDGIETNMTVAKYMTFVALHK